jgi:hypothetical protein
MPLSVFAEVVSHGGYLPQLAALDKKRKFFTKKNGVFAGVTWFIFLTMFLTAFFGILGAPDELVGICAITGVFGAMMIIVGSLFLLPSSEPAFPGFQPPNMAPWLQGAQQSALPPQQSYPVSDYVVPQTGSWRDTNDLQPTSVTESTTKLLDTDDRQDYR